MAQPALTESADRIYHNVLALQFPNIISDIVVNVWRNGASRRLSAPVAGGRGPLPLPRPHPLLLPHVRSARGKDVSVRIRAGFRVR